MKNLKDTTILVTGGAGYIGSAIVDALLKEDATVVIYDDLSTGRADKINAHATFIEGDVTDGVHLENVFASYTFDAVVHCAAKKVMSESEENPSKYFKNNVGGTIELLSCMERHGVPKIIFSSTAAVYAPTTDSHPVTERDEINPKSVYGRSKLMCEMLITEYARLGKIKEYAILRYFNVAGDVGLMYAEPSPQGVFPLLAEAFKEGKAFNVFGTRYETKDGSAVRDYIHLSDLAKAHVKALQSVNSGIYNLGTSNGYTVYELINAFKEVTKRELEVVPMPPRPGDVAVMLADASKAGVELGWSPERNLRDMVQSTAALYGM